MSEYDPGAGVHEAYGTCGQAGDHAIVAQYAPCSQARVVDVNHDGDPGTGPYPRGATSYAGI